MRIIFVYEPDVEPLVSTRLTWAQRNNGFVPLDQVPSNDLDPFEALALKEEQELKLDGNNSHEATWDDVSKPVTTPTVALGDEQWSLEKATTSSANSQEEIFLADDAIADSLGNTFFCRCRRKVCMDKKLHRLFGYRS